MPAETNQSRSITAGFTRRLRRTSVLVLLSSMTVGYLITDRVWQARWQRTLSDEARLCAAMIIPGPNGDLSESVSRLQDQFERLVAVGALSPAGNLGVVYPTRAAHRQAVLAAFEHESRAVRIRSPYDGHSLTVSGIIVPLNGSSGPAAQRVIVLLEHSDAAFGSLHAAAVFALAIGGLGLLGAMSLRRWLERQITLPLRRLTERIRHPVRSPHNPGIPELRKWYETAGIAEQVDGLLETLAETEVRIERMELETEQQIRQQEIGFHRQLRRAKDRAKLDSLTGLWNRSYLDEKIEPLLRQHETAGEDLTAVMLDVDNFKQYNDANGHQAGDSILKFAGTLLRGGIRPTDHAIRYGGDEFLLLLPDTNARQAEITVERLLRLFRQYVSRLHPTHQLSLSAGVASLADDQPRHGQDLIAKADAALYVAKRKGKNTVQHYKPQHNLTDCAAGAE